MNEEPAAHGHEPYGRGGHKAQIVPGGEQQERDEDT